jgi:NAD(P)-dependent dehydrogenase (short-subunit alcohol dehydrogenase family)
MTTERGVPDMADELTGKVIVLTGGADGIGRALAYGREGARVAIGDRHFDAAQHTAAEVGGGF